MATEQDAGTFERIKRELVEAQDDEQRLRAIGELLREYQTFIERKAHPLIPAGHRASIDTEDIRQSVAWRVAERLRQGRIMLLGERQFRRLLTMIVRRRVIDRTARRPAKSLDQGTAATLPHPIASGESPSRQVARAEFSAEMLARIEQILSPEEYQAFRARHMEDLGHAELGVRLGISEEAARKRVERAKRRLKAALGDFDSLWPD